MSTVEKIQCPSCGSNSTYKLIDGNYKCNYCQSNFIVKEQQQKVKERTIIQPEVTLPKSKPKLMWFYYAGIMVVMVGFYASFYFNSSFKLSSITNALEKNKPGIEMTYAYVGSKGAIVWIVSKIDESDNVSYKLRVVDPKINKIVSTVVIIPPFKSRDNISFSDKVGSKFLQYNDIVYNISKDDGLAGYNSYTGEKEVSNISLVKDFTELKNGIIKVEELPNENGFMITSADGEVFRFDPYTKKLITKQTKASTKNKEKIHTQLYLTNGLKHQLYLFTKKGNGFPLVSGSFLEESEIGHAKGPKGRNVKDIFGNINIEKVSDRSFFRAQPLLRDGAGNLVLFYKSDLSANATIILESISPEGKTNWTVQNPSFSYIGKNISSEDINCTYKFSPSILILSIYTDQQLYIAIDVKSGEVLWNFYPQKYANKNPVFDN